MGYKIRVSGRGAMIRDGKILLTKMDFKGEQFYILPGGGQELGETLEECVKRECLEETGYSVSVGDVIFVREYIGEEGFSEGLVDGRFHQVEIVFACKVIGESGEASEIDTYQTGLEWIELSKLDELSVYPRVLKRALEGKEKIYIGAERG